MSSGDISPLLTLGNVHLGRKYHTFSIPARKTCPGMTEACEDVCYALDYFFILSQNRRKHTRNWERAQDGDEFGRDMLAEIRYKRVKLLRIHVAGDFFSPEYVETWHWIARRAKTTRFLFYTRSWRAEGFREPLIALASLANVYAFWSEDRDTGPCDFPVGRRAFLCTNLRDELLVPPGILVFRHQTRTVAKFLNGSWVCAKEQGTRTALTCSDCGQCVNRDPWPVAPGQRALASDPNS